MRFNNIKKLYLSYNETKVGVKKKNNCCNSRYNYQFCLSKYVTLFNNLILDIYVEKNRF